MDIKVTKVISKRIRLFLPYTYILYFLLEGVNSSPADHKTVSQCYDAENSFSFVSLYCGANQVIQIERAFHGAHLNPGIPHCGELANDCVEDMTSKYDWDTCEGMHSCVQTVRKISIPKCERSSTGMKTETEESTEKKAKMLQYLQVEYNCISSTTEKTEYQNTIIEKRMQVVTQSLQTQQMCTNFTVQEKSILLQNPGYPNYYVTGTDCRCVIKAPEHNKVSVIFHDLSLVKRGQHCIDWLLLQSPEHKDSTMVACGLLDGHKRRMESKSNWLLLHFHTARGKTPSPDRNKDHKHKPMSGFKIQIQSNHVNPLNIKCYTVDPNHIDSIVHRNGQDDTSNLILPASEWEVAPPMNKHSQKPNLTNNAHRNKQCWATVQLMSIFFLCATYMQLYNV